MKKLLILIILLISIHFGLAAQDPGLTYCQLQGYDAIYSVKIIYGDKQVQFVPGNPKNDKIIFPAVFRREDRSNSGYIDVKEIYGLSDSDKKELIQKIESETNFGKYMVKKVNTTEGYGQGWLYQIGGDFEIFISCDFPNGTTCSWQDFKDKKCGEEYIKNIPCVKDGETIRQMFQSCCEGLEIYNPRPDCVGCLPICRIPPTNFFIRFWEWIKRIF